MWWRLALGAACVVLVGGMFLLCRQAWRQGTRWVALSYVVLGITLLGGVAYFGYFGLAPGLRKPHRFARTRAAGKVPNLILTQPEIDQATSEIAAADSSSLEQLAVLEEVKPGVAIYNAVFSPVSASGKNVLIDRQPTKVDFYIGTPSPDNAVPANNTPVSPELSSKSGAQQLLVTLSCSFCSGPRVEKGTLEYTPEAAGPSTHAMFSILPDRSTTKESVSDLVFEITGNGVLYDNVVVPVAIEAAGANGSVAAVASDSPNAAVGNKVQPAGSRDVDLTITAKDVNNNVVIALAASNTDLAQSFAGKSTDQNGVPKDFDTGLSVDDLSATLRDDYEDLRRTIGQNKDLQNILGGDRAALDLPADTSLSPAQGQVLSNILQSVGVVLYRKLFVNTADPDLHTLIGAVEHFKRKDGHPTLVRIETGDIFIPWELLHPPGPMAPSQFWGFRYEIVVDPLGRHVPGYYPGKLQYASGPLVFGKYDAPLGKDQNVSELGDAEAEFLSGQLGFKGLLKVFSSDAFKSAITNTASPVRVVVVFLHGQNDISAAVPNAGSVSQTFGGPELIFGPSDTLSVKSLEDLYGTVDTDQVILFNAQPLVFLNACETGSGGFLATNSRNFPRTFLEMGARGVIATEAPVWINFADDFGKDLLTDLGGKGPVSLSLFNTRVKFLKKFNNPLGLLYEYSGGVDAALIEN